MNIGVFGDSYAERYWDKIWWKYLETEHGHTVTCFGQGGSSIMWSAKQIEQHAHKFDFIIWCLTCPGRFSFQMTEHTYIHSTSVSNNLDHYNLTADVKKKMQVSQDYLKYVYNSHEENISGCAMAHYFMQRYPNLMIIPCFIDPLTTEFNLYTLCEHELQHFFPDKKVWEVYQDYDDVRPGHLTDVNHHILAQLINNNLVPGIFQTRYTNFKIPAVPQDQVVTKKAKA
jgi:hypothetical protein